MNNNNTKQFLLVLTSSPYIATKKGDLVKVFSIADEKWVLTKVDAMHEHGWSLENGLFHPKNNSEIGRYNLHILSLFHSIEKNDWYVNLCLNTCHQFETDDMFASNFEYKIIASTNYEFNLPSIPDLFVDRYIKSYDSKFEQRLVEIVCSNNFDSYPDVNENNEIIIERMGEVYNNPLDRTKVVSLLYYAFESMSDWKNDGLTTHDLNLKINDFFELYLPKK